MVGIQPQSRTNSAMRKHAIAQVESVYGRSMKVESRSIEGLQDEAIRIRFDITDEGRILTIDG